MAATLAADPAAVDKAAFSLELCSNCVRAGVSAFTRLERSASKRKGLAEEEAGAKSASIGLQWQPKVSKF